MPLSTIFFYLILELFRQCGILLFFPLDVHIVKQCPVESVDLDFQSTQKIIMTIQWLCMYSLGSIKFIVSEKILFFFIFPYVIRRVWRYQRIRISKDRQHNDQKKKEQKNKQRSTKHTHKIKDQVTRTPLKNMVAVIIDFQTIQKLNTTFCKGTPKEHYSYVCCQLYAVYRSEMWIDFDSWCLTLLSAIYQLYLGDQF